MKFSLLVTGLLFLQVSLFSQTTIYSEDFQVGFPAGFTQITNASDGGWNTGTAGQLSSQAFNIQNQGSGRIIGTNDDDCNCNKSNDFLMTDTINLGSFSGSKVFFRFDQFYYDASYQGDQESATLEISTNNGNSWSVIKQLSFGAWSRESVDLTSYAGQTIMLGFRYDDGGGFLYGLALDNLLIEVPSDNNLLVEQIEIPRYHKISDGAISIEADVLNNGGANVSAFDINYVVNGDTVTNNITGINISPLDDYSFTIPSGFLPPAPGDYEITVFVSTVNGNPNQINANGVAESIVTVYDTAYQRAPLYEVFTSSTCGPCRPGNENFKNVMDNYPGEYVAVKFQQDFPGAGDPYVTNESDSRRGYYGITSIPSMQIDGGWDGNANSFTVSLHEEAYESPAFVKIDAEYKIWPDSQKIEVCLNTTALEELNDKTLHVAILENKTTANVGNNGETEFFDVFKKWFDESGSTISIAPGTNYETCMTYTFNGDYRLPNNASDLINNNIEHSVEEFTDLNVALWLQDENTDEIYQSAFGNEINTEANYSVGPNAIEDTTTNNDTTSISINEKNEIEYAIFPNPAQNELFVDFHLEESGNTDIKIYDQLGRLQKIYSTEGIYGSNTARIKTGDLSNGFYILQMQVGEKSFREKFLIQR